MADSKPITLTAPLEYQQCIWGDLIYGTKTQIQSLGIGADLSFPGELGGPRRTLKVPDPRGFPATITSDRWLGDGRFSVSIPLFEEHPRPEPIARPYVPGVTKRECSWFDEYVGSAVALAALGLVQLNQLPCQPGMRKIRATILPDGSVFGGPPTASCAEAKKPGAKKIERVRANIFCVRVRVTAEERQQRGERAEIAEREWQWRIQKLPRPAPLNEERAAILAQRTHLRLVWSVPRAIGASAK